MKQRKAYRKENTTIEWGDGGKIGNKNKLILALKMLKQHKTVVLPVVRYDGGTWHLK